MAVDETTDEMTGLAIHCLHLCNNSNIDETVFSYLAGADAFVTNDTEEWERKFSENRIKCPIKKPNEVKQDERIVVDGSSFASNFEKWEEKWKKQGKAICIYNMEKMDPSILKHLVNVHDKMLMSINKVRIVSDKNLEKEINNISPEIVEGFVKKELKNLVLSLLLSKPMCGTDLVKILYEKFKVFISPGMIYPALCELEKSGLLKYDYELKNKVYSIQERGQVKLLLNKHVRANSLLSQFLVGE